MGYFNSKYGLTIVYNDFKVLEPDNNDPIIITTNNIHVSNLMDL